MNILSILWSTCSTAALLCDGQIVACVSEERFSRRKNDETYPLRSIEAVLAEGGVEAREIDLRSSLPQMVELDCSGQAQRTD